MKKYLLSFLVIFISFQAQAESIIFSVDEWCPHTCLDETANEPDSEYGGYYLDVLEEIFVPLGYDLQFVVVPWKRALDMVQHGEIDAILSPTKQEAPSLLFPDEEIANLQWCFFTTKDNNWRFDDETGLSGQIIGYLEGSSYNDEIDTYLYENRHDHSKVVRFHTINYMKSAMEMLVVYGRITAFIDELQATDYFIHKNDYGQSVVNAGCLECRKMFVAFSPAKDTSREYAEIFSRGMQRLRQTGKLDDILSRYGLRDWRLTGLCKD